MDDLSSKLNEVFNEGFHLFEDRDRLIQDLDILAKKLQTPATIIGGAALRAYNYDRMTKDIDLVMTASDAKKLGDELYKDNNFTFIGHSTFQHTSGMSVNFCPTGFQAGHDKFPSPESNQPGLHFASLPLLLSLKVRAKRFKDKGDYAELIKRNNLTIEYIKEKVLPLLNSMDKQLAILLWKQTQKEI